MNIIKIELKLRGNPYLSFAPAIPKAALASFITD